MDKVTNDDFLKRDKSILNGIRQRKHRWIGHGLRYDKFLQETFEGRMLGEKTRRNTDAIMLHDLTMNSNYVTIKQTAAERVMWRHNSGTSSRCCIAED